MTSPLHQLPTHQAWAARSDSLHTLIESGELSDLIERVHNPALDR